jgi:hypothetical protein
VVPAAGCRGRDVEFDCEYSRELYALETERDGALHEEVPTKGPWPAALVLTTEGINQLLASTVEDDVPFTGEVPFGPSNIFFEPESDPVIEIAEVPGCENCLLYSIDFLVELDFGTSDISSGTGNAKLAIPMILEPGEGGTSTLVAAYDQSEIIEFEVTVYGLDSDEYEGMSEAISILMERNVKEQFGPTELLEFDAIGLGDGVVQLSARELTSHPEAGAVSLGLGTNLVLPDGADLDVDPVVPDGHLASLQFAPGLLQAILERMIAEGNIPRTYDADGRPAEGGEHAASIVAVEGADTEEDRLDTRFRVWRLRDGYCGYVEADLPLFVELDEEDQDLAVRPGAVGVLSGKGVGSIVAEEEDLVAENQALLETFKAAVAKHVSITVNYDELSIPGKVVYFFTKDVQVTPAALSTYLDFLVVEAP